MFTPPFCLFTLSSGNLEILEIHEQKKVLRISKEPDLNYQVFKPIYARLGKEGGPKLKGKKIKWERREREGGKGIKNSRGREKKTKKGTFT